MKIVSCHFGSNHFYSISVLKMANAESHAIPNYIKFALGGSAGMTATCFVQPLDLIKTRMQLGVTSARVSSFSVIINVMKNEGFFAFYNGLSAGLLRQATYTTGRLGVYQWLFTAFSSDEGTPPSFLMKTVIGMGAGMCGAFIGTPSDLALVRMTADGRLPVEQRRNYSSVFNALKRIVQEEGVLALLRGAVPTMGRAMVVNGAQLASYSQAKEYLLTTGYFHENIILHFTSSMISGLITTVASMPVDIAKTRIQNMKYVDGKPEYKGVLDVLIKAVRKEGVFSLWKGFTPYYARIGPHTVLTFIFLEQYTNAYIKFVLGKQG